MHSLYWRIFLAFWVALALILVGTVTVAVNATAHRTDRPWVQRGQLYAQAARAFESGGPEALGSWLQSLPAEPFGRTFVVEPGGRELLGRPLPPSLSGARDAAGEFEIEKKILTEGFFGQDPMRGGNLAQRRKAIEPASRDGSRPGFSHFGIIAEDAPHGHFR